MIYLGLISLANSDMTGSVPDRSTTSEGALEVSAPVETPLGHSLVIADQGFQALSCSSNEIEQ